jgi:hypothetical protein
MSQKSSLPQVIQCVSEALMPDSGEYEIICAIKSFRYIRELILEFHHTVLKDTKTREKYHHLLEILKKHFRTVEYRKDPKGAWVSNVFCRK